MKYIFLSLRGINSIISAWFSKLLIEFVAFFIITIWLGEVNAYYYISKVVILDVKYVNVTSEPSRGWFWPSCRSTMTKTLADYVCSNMLYIISAALHRNAQQRSRAALGSRPVRSASGRYISPVFADIIIFALFLTATIWPGETTRCRKYFLNHLTKTGCMCVDIAGMEYWEDGIFHP
jgi:hypothetical protein